MSSPPSRPTRRRRRIVVTTAVLALGLCWWFWPRGDQRFVGTWAVQGPLTLHSPRVTKVVLTADGRGRIDREYEGRRSTIRCRWWTEDGAFVRRNIPDWGWGSVGNFAYNAYATLTGRINPYRQRIVSAEPDQLRLECPNVIIDDRPDIQTLTRISE